MKLYNDYDNAHTRALVLVNDLNDLAANFEEGEPEYMHLCAAKLVLNDLLGALETSMDRFKRTTL